MCEMVAEFIHVPSKVILHQRAPQANPTKKRQSQLGAHGRHRQGLRARRRAREHRAHGDGALLEILGSVDKFSRPSSHICAVLSSSTNPRRSTATPAVCLLAEPFKSQVRRTQAIGQRFVCENVPRMQARSASHDWLTLTAIDTAHLCKSGRPHFISAPLEKIWRSRNHFLLFD